MINVKVFDSDSILITEAQGEFEIRFGRGFDQDLVIPRLGIARAQGIISIHDNKCTIKNISPDYPLIVDKKRIVYQGEATINGSSRVELNDQIYLDVVVKSIATTAESSHPLRKSGDSISMAGGNSSKSQRMGSMRSSSFPIPGGGAEDLSNHLPVEADITRITSTESDKSLILDCIRGKLQGKSVVVDHNFFTIGRGDGVGFKLDDTLLSREHIRFVVVDGNFVLEDLNSANGVFVNQVKSVRKEIKGGEYIELGNHVFRARMVYDQAYKALQSIEEEVHTLFPEMNGYNQRPGSESKSANYKGKPKSLLEQYKRLPANRRRLVLIMGVMVAMILFLDSSDEEKKTPVANAKKTSAKNLTSFDKLSTENQNLVRQHYQAAEDYYRSGDYEKSRAELDALRQILAEPYQDSARLYLLVENQLDSIRNKEDQDKLREKLEQERLQIEGWVDHAKKLVAKKEFEDAEKIFALIEEREPENSQVAAMRAEIQNYKLKIDEEKRAKELAKQQWDRINKKLNLANGSFKSGRYLAAIEDAEKVLEDEYHIKGLRSKAQKLIGKSKRRISSLQGPLMDEAEALSQSFDLPNLLKAKGNYEKVLVFNPLNENAKKKLADLREFVNKRMKAIYSEAIVLESLGDRLEAKQRFEQIINSSFQDDEYYEKAKSKLEDYAIEQSVTE